MKIIRVLYILTISLLIFILFSSKSAYRDGFDSGKINSRIDSNLQQKIINWANDQSGDYAISVRELDGNKRIANLNAFDKMTLASTYKLFLAFAVYHEVEEGNLKINSKMNGGNTVKKCIEKMIVYSDNPCGKDLGFLIGWKRAEEILNKAGINNVKLDSFTGEELDEDMSGTSQAHSKLLQLIHTGNFISKKHSQDLIEYMEDQRWRERIPAGVPNDVKVADKPGFWLDIQNDAGIVYGPKSTYILVVLSSGGKADDIAELSEIIYDYLQN